MLQRGRVGRPTATTLLTGKMIDGTKRDLHMWLTRVAAALKAVRSPERGAPRRSRGGVEQARLLQISSAITASAVRLRLILAAQPSQRLRIALAGVLLLEAFCAYILFIHLVTALTDSPFNNPQPPNDTGLAFLAIVVLPAVLIATRSQYMKARAREGEWEREAQRRARQAATDLARAYATLYLQPGAPLEIAQAAYTAAMKRAHPDMVGGDTTAAAELNWAIATIREHANSQ